VVWCGWAALRVWGGVSAGWLGLVCFRAKYNSRGGSLVVLQHNKRKNIGSLMFALQKVISPLCLVPLNLPCRGLLSCNLVFVSNVLYPVYTPKGAWSLKSCYGLVIKKV